MSMNKLTKLGALAAVLVFGSMIANAQTVLDFQPYSLGGQNYIYQPGGGGLVQASQNWTVSLYRDISGNGPGTLGDGDESLLWSTTSDWSVDGVFLSNVASIPNEGDWVFARVFDSAGDYVNLVPNGNGGNGTLGAGTYRVHYIGSFDSLWVNSTAADGSDWFMAVPEPGTLALMGLGAIVIGLRRRFARKD